MIFHTTSKKPILLVGNGVRSSGAAELVYDFIEKTKIPALTTMNGVDLVQDKYRIGFIGTYGNRAANMIINESDLVISVGARLGLRQIGHKKELFAPKAKLVRCDIDQYELGRQIKDDEEKYPLDAQYFMELLLREDIPEYEDWNRRCFSVKDILEGYDDLEGNLCIKKISSLLPQNPVIAVDVGQNQCWAAQSLGIKGTEGRIFIAGGYGAMGCGLPFAIGASISSGNGLVYCITGDGGLQMNIQELEVLKREQLPIKIFVLNNRILGKISEIQHVSYSDRYAQTTEESGYTVPDFKRIALAYGIEAVTVEKYGELEDYTNLIHNDLPCVFNILLPKETFLIPKIKWETCSIKPVLDLDLQSKIRSLLDI